MLFKDLKNGYPVYIFNHETVEVTQGKVLGVAGPHFDNHYGSSTDMVVDVTVEHGGATKSYTFKDGTEIGYAGQFVIATGREGILREVEAMKSQSEQALSKVDAHKTIIDKCSTILEELNPAFKEKQENNARFSKIEQDLQSFGSDMRELKELIRGLSNTKERKG